MAGETHLESHRRGQKWGVLEVPSEGDNQERGKQMRDNKELCHAEQFH